MIHRLQIRAWHPKSKRMYLVPTINFQSKYVNLSKQKTKVGFEGVKLMAFTGVFDRSSFDNRMEEPFWREVVRARGYKKKDWKGCPIFQGDIVEGEVATTVSTTAKSREAKRAKFSVGMTMDGSVHLIPIKPLSSKWKTTPALSETTVIGNVYENLTRKNPRKVIEEAG